MALEGIVSKQIASLTFKFEPPSPMEFIKFRADCGWGEIGEDTAQAALDASVLDVTCRSGEELVGFARVVGDGILYFYIQDVIVSSDWRGHRIGQKIMSILMKRLEERVHDGATIGLMAADGKESFYEHFGFQARPTDRLGAGMTQFVKKNN
ncbi:Acetyltransferase, GNAT family protein [Sulfitobacter noctilucae]|uniref:GNAT family N-acetyltransferase n=1 Tax=Sulfitobacter noctilucae TaxID=1342302 RepID=UPI00069BBBDC|nr:GNAT family N-acetyltransferase [Sulfitobacter noctilucae]KIN60182.1 Acetyltransferase, GNAT family protein [Sulfitobacter noctilucae]